METSRKSIFPWFPLEEERASVAKANSPQNFFCVFFQPGLSSLFSSRENLRAKVGAKPQLKKRLHYVDLEMVIQSYYLCKFEVSALNHRRKLMASGLAELVPGERSHSSTLKTDALCPKENLNFSPDYNQCL